MRKYGIGIHTVQMIMGSRDSYDDEIWLNSEKERDDILKGLMERAHQIRPDEFGTGTQNVDEIYRKITKDV